MSEKMDGVRAYWNGKKSISKHGKEIKCPPWFTEHLPSTFQLDGELWMGRGTTHTSVTAILNLKKKQNGDDAGWKQIGYFIFDIPSSNKVYEERIDEMESLKPDLPSHVHVVANIKCNGNEHLRDYLASVMAHNGEGLMARKPASQETGYTASLLKVKVFFRPISGRGLQLVKQCFGNFGTN